MGGAGQPDEPTREVLLHRASLLGIVTVLACSGCPKRDTGDADRAALVSVLDEGWNTFPAPDVVPPAIDDARVASDLARIEAARIRWPWDVELGWRAARLHVAAGVGVDSPQDARRAFARAREVAIGCVEGASGRWRNADGSVTAVDGRAPCVAWAAEAWTRWMDTWSSDAARVDEAIVGALVDAVRDVPDEPVRRVASTASARLRRLRTGAAP